MAELSNRLKKIIEERGISQKWLADATDTKEATISRYINGVNKSSRVDILVKIANALDVSTDYLLCLSDVPNRASPTYSAEENILISAYRNASERDIAVIWQLLEPYLSPSQKELLSLLQEQELVGVG